jgi:hypothetical protein
MLKIWFSIMIVLTVFILGCKDSEIIIDDSTQAKLEEQFSLNFEKTATVSPVNITVKFVKVTEDSRCASGVVCIWAGQVSALVNVNNNGKDLGDIKLTLGPNKGGAVKDIGGYYLKLLEVKPYPISTKKIEPSEYIATLIISKFMDN